MPDPSFEPSPQAYSVPWPPSHSGYSLPDPRDRGACARFRLRRKSFKTGPRQPPSPPLLSNVVELQHTVLKLSHNLNLLAESHAFQTRIFENHLVGCRQMLQDIPSLVKDAHREVLNATHSQLPGGTLSQAAAPVVDQHPAPAPLPCLEPALPVENSHPEPYPLPTVTPAVPPNVPLSPHADTDRPSLSSSLPRLRGLFNKPR